MKLSTHCPFCNDVMITEFTGTYKVSKFCAHRPTHYIKFIALETDDVFEIIIRISVNPMSYAKWVFTSKSLRVEMTSISTPLYLPWFEPDLSNYNKLLQKLKTYMVFS